MRKLEKLDPTRTTRIMPATTSRERPVRSKWKRVTDKVSPAGSPISTGRWSAKPHPRNRIARGLPALRPELVTRPPMSMPRWVKENKNPQKNGDRDVIIRQILILFFLFIYSSPLGRSDRVRRIGFEITAGRGRRHHRLCGRSDDQGRDDRIRRNPAR